VPRSLVPCRERGVPGEVHHAPAVADPASAARVSRPHGSRMSRSVLADRWSLPWTRGWRATVAVAAASCDSKRSRSG
jgi:hypothetical protein